MIIPMEKTKAVTLIELLISSVILVVVMLAVYSSFHTGIFGYKNIGETISFYQTARQVLEQINSDLRNSFAYSAKETKFKGSKENISFLALADIFTEDKVTEGYAFISYRLEGGRLLRTCRRNQESLNEKSEAEPEEMASGVKEIVFNYGYDNHGQMIWKDSWGEEEGKEEEQNRLPLCVKVSLSLKDKTIKEFERTIYL